MQQDGIDRGRAFFWGRTSTDYARYRDVYPEAFYQRLLEAGVGLPDQEVLDIGTGTGVLPRHMAKYGAYFIGVDRSPNQIAAAAALTVGLGLPIRYRVAEAEMLDFPDASFDAVTACQCFLYFDRAKLLPNIARMLKDDGLFAILYMNWLPHEDEIAGRSEEIVLAHNPDWSGHGFTRTKLAPPAWAAPLFAVERQETFDLQIPFTRESWNGRMRACRGVGASLPPEKIAAFEKDHLAMLQTLPEQFTILHEAALLLLRKEREKTLKEYLTP